MSVSSSLHRHLPSSTSRHGPIGVFDSGIGGLTVVSALRRVLPDEDIFYIGDTARVPYGGKSPSTIERYSLEIAGLLLAEGAKIIVVACNSASALAIQRLRETIAVPVLGVIEPGAQAAVNATSTGTIAVIGTRATIRSGAYERNIHRFKPDATVLGKACPLFVPLVEEGWLQDEITRGVAGRYLEPMLAQNADTLVLGCTHYPLLAPLLGQVCGDGVTLVDSAQTCALAVKQLLAERGLNRPPAMSASGSTFDIHVAGEQTHVSSNPDPAPGSLHVALTDAPGDFLHIVSEALHLDIREVQSRRVQNYAFV